MVERALSTVFKATGLFTVANYLRGECSSVRIGNEGYTFSLKELGVKAEAEARVTYVLD